MRAPTSDIVVAVVDTGVTTVNQTFSFPYWNGSAIQTIPMVFSISPGMSASRLTRPRDIVFERTVLDLDGHGTHVASTIAETTNDMMRTAGIAYNAQIMPVKVCTAYWDEQIDRSLATYQAEPPRTLLGAARRHRPWHQIRGGCRAPRSSISVSAVPILRCALRDAIDYAVRRGVFVAIAMGNDFEDDNPIIYPAKYAELFHGAMSVAAVGRSLAIRAEYSGTGSHCEITAPGGDFSLDGPPGLIYQTMLDEPVIRPARRAFTSYPIIGIQGTSMASPHVAGLAALIMSQRPGITPAQVEGVIRATAKDIGAPGKDDEFGYGLIQPRNALFGQGIRR